MNDLEKVIRISEDEWFFPEDMVVYNWNGDMNKAGTLSVPGSVPVDTIEDEK